MNAVGHEQTGIAGSDHGGADGLPVTVVPPLVRGATWTQRASTFAVFLALGLSVGTWAAAVPAVKAAFGLDDAQLSLVLLAIPIASVVATTSMGVLAPRFASGAATVLTAMATLIGFALPGLAQSYAQLIVCGIAIGLGAGALEVAVNGHASDIEQRWGSTIMSSFHAAFSIGGLVGVLFGDLMVWAGAGLQGQLWVPLACGALLVLGALPGLGRGTRGAPHAGAGLRWPAPALLLLGLVAMLIYLVEGAMADWSGVYMATVAGAPLWLAGLGYAAFSVTMAAGRLMGDLITNRLGAQVVLTLGGLIAAAGLALAALWPAPWPVAAGFALVGVGAANIVPVVFSAAGRTADTPSAGIAFVSSLGFAGFLGGPPLIGAVANWAGLRVALALLVIAALLVSVAGLRAGQPSRRRSRT